MDYKDLQVFLTLCHALHLGKASTQLHMSPSTLSRRLMRMEEELGVQLMNRETSPLQLTAAGELMRAHAEQTLLGFQQLKASVSAKASDLTGRLTLFCSVTASYSFLADLLSEFRERYPNVELRIHTGDAADAISRVEAGEADVAIAARPEKLSAGLTFKAMAVSPLLFIAPKMVGLISELSNSPVSWEKVPMVLSETGLARSRVDHWFSNKKKRPYIYAQVTGNEAIVSMVALGVGVGVVPELVLKNSPMSGRVRVLNVQPELEPFAIGLCAKSERLNDALLNALWETARK